MFNPFIHRLFNEFKVVLYRLPLILKAQNLPPKRMKVLPIAGTEIMSNLFITELENFYEINNM